MQRRSAKNRHSNARTPAETKIRELSGRKSRQKRAIEGLRNQSRMPGMDEKNIEVKVANGNLTIKGEKQEEKEEKKKDYYLRERKFGSFERSFSIPEGVDVHGRERDPCCPRLIQVWLSHRSAAAAMRSDRINIALRSSW